MRSTSRWRVACGILLLTLSGATARGGMPIPLPSDFDITEVLQTSYWTTDRLQTISFFLVVILVAAWLVKILWNTLHHDWPALPRLRYGSALSATILWGLLFVIVLTMISGARELMTPGAWVQDGYTYRLADRDEEADAREADADRRMLNLERLSIALMKHAIDHDGRFPGSLQAVDNPNVRTIPGWEGVEYFYVPGVSMRDEPRLLAFEPELEGVERYVLLSDGTVKQLPTERINQLLTHRDTD